MRKRKTPSSSTPSSFPGCSNSEKSPTPKKRKRRDFTCDETLTVTHHFKEFIENKDLPLRKDEIGRVAESQPDLKTLVEEIGVKNLIIKIRTERSKI